VRFADAVLAGILASGCPGHKFACNAPLASGLPDSQIKTTLLQLIDSRQAELGCG
jgi:hypothetical protein